MAKPNKEIIMVGSTGKVYGPKTQFASNLDDMHKAAKGKIKGRTVVAKAGVVDVGKQQNAFVKFLVAIASRIPSLKNKVSSTNAKLVTEGYLKYLKANKAEAELDIRKAVFVFNTLAKGLKPAEVAKLEDIHKILEIGDKLKNENEAKFKAGAFRKKASVTHQRPVKTPEKTPSGKPKKTLSGKTVYSDKATMKKVTSTPKAKKKVVSGVKRKSATKVKSSRPIVKGKTKAIGKAGKTKPKTTSKARSK